MLATFREAAGQHGIPASTLTDNGMVFTTRLAGAGRQGGRNAFEVQLRSWNVVQKNSRPNHPTTCGKVERFQQTRTHNRTHVILLIQDLDVRIVNAATGELLRELTIDLNRDYQPRK